MRYTLALLTLLASLWVLPPAPAHAAEPEAEAPPVHVPDSVGAPKDTEGSGTRSQSEQPRYVYVPREIGEPGGRIGAGTRGGTGAMLYALAPHDHVGLTTRAQPVFYWYAAEPITTRVDLVVRNERTTTPLLEVQLPLPVPEGFNAIRLADYGAAATLQPGTNYQWFVSLVPDPARRSKDVTVGGWVRFEPVPEALAERLAKAGPERAVFVYAENGFWYDAIDAVSSQIAAAPGDAGARAHRAALLDQVELDEVGTYDRGRRGASESNARLEIATGP